MDSGHNWSLVPIGAPREEQHKIWAPATDPCWIGYIADVLEPGRMLHVYEKQALRHVDQIERHRRHIDRGTEHELDSQEVDDMYKHIYQERGFL